MSQPPAESKGLLVNSSRSQSTSVVVEERSSTHPTNNSSSIDDEYSEAWYDLGAPIQLPFLKYTISVASYLVDNYFLVKNSYNALTQNSDPEIKEDDGRISYPKKIAGAILFVHVTSSILISIIDSLNKDAISGQRGKYLNNKHKRVIFFRLLAHLTLTMKLFRYTTALVENLRRNRGLHTLRMRRSNISEIEIQFVVDQKKNQLVESYYDLVESFFKTVPAALLQVFFMFQTNPEARLRLYSTVDQDRFATVFFTIITASISSANYQLDYLRYKKVLHFQDCFRSGFMHKISLKIPGDICLCTNIPIQMATIGIRICFYSVLIFWSTFQFVITTLIILLVNYFLTFVWSRTAWRFRPVLENPLFGLPWLCFNIIDLWINLFIPGVHYPKPLDYLLNFYTTLFTGMFVFRGFDFLSPTKTSTSPHFSFNSSSIVINSSSTSFDGPYSQLFNNVTTGSPLLFVPLELLINSPEQPEDKEETLHIIGTIIKWLILAHEYLTFNQISYAGFFYNVVKCMNIVNLVCFLYTCCMNALKFYDLDFPIQIVNSFYASMFNYLHQSRSGPTTAITQSENGNLNTSLTKKKDEIFLVFSMLPNSRFFRNIHTIRKSKWTFVNSKKLDELVQQLIKEGSNENKKCYSCFDKFLKFISPILYPARFREAKFNWDIPTDKSSIVSSLASHPLREELEQFINDVYENVGQDRKLLLAVFCANYNDIARHYTSLRLKKMFQFFEIPIKKEIVYSAKLRNREGKRIKLDCELGYVQRLVREARGKVDSKIF